MKMRLHKNVELLRDGNYRVFNDWTRKHSLLLTEAEFKQLRLIQPPTTWTIHNLETDDIMFIYGKVR
jgi:hypothetical protein